MYQNGFGMERNFNEAAKWFQRAAEQGDAKAQSNLGAMYVDGQGVEKDQAKAYQWLTLASEKGELTATKTLYGLEPSMAPDQVAKGKRLAAEWKVQASKAATAKAER
jgi:TPR repeat protein